MSGGGPPRLLVLVGPTGTGKSAIAVPLAERLDGEIVGCDAVQLYRGLDAATAKPGIEERRRVPHHLVDCVDPRTDFSLWDYVRAAERTIEGIARRGRVPLIVGGTGLYLRGLLRGIISAPPRDAALRRRLAAILHRRRGLVHLRAWLRRADVASERRIPTGDVQRTLRAIELARAGGPTWSERLAASGTWEGGAERYRTVKVGLDVERAALGERLDARVDRFFSAGLVAEVRGLLERGVPPEANALKAIGYREVLAALARGEDPAEVRDAVKRNTRRYAKRQRTWLRSEPGVVWFDLEEREAGSAIVERILALWREGAASTEG